MTARRRLVSLSAVRFVDEPVTLEVYDEAWPEQFSAEATRLVRELAETAVAVEHIGSTAVVGLTAKPIIDVMVGVSSLAASEELARRLIQLGYEDCGGVDDRQYFRKRAAEPHYNVQVIEYPSPTWTANVLFRDFLRSDPEAAKRYAEAKRAAAVEAPTLLAYSRLKTLTIEKLLSLARARQ
jgi:GrpB-like predicted nucleotidyltransferase (UPF0157 family)